MVSALATSAALTQCSLALHQGTGLLQHATERSLVSRASAPNILLSSWQGKDHQSAASRRLAVPVSPASDQPGVNVPRRFPKAPQASAASVDTAPAAQPPQVPGPYTRTGQIRHLLRIRTLPDQPAPANRAKSEIWEEVTPGAWQEHLLYPRSFFDLFLKYVNQASDGVWGKGLGPISSMSELSWLDFDLGKDARAVSEHEKGLSSWIGFMVCSPATMESFKLMGDFWLPFTALDDWLEQQGPEELEVVVAWFRDLWRMSSSETGLDLQRAVDVMPQCFAVRPHLSEAASNYCSALLAYNARAAQVDQAWVRRVSWGTYVYMHLGLAPEVEANLAFKSRGKLPTLEEYLRYRAYSIGDIGMTVVACVETGVCLSVERAKAAGLLWLFAALATALFNDSLAATKEPASGLLNAVTIVGQARAVQLHNIFVDCFCEEAERFLADATPGDSSREFVDALTASLFGGVLWHNTSARFRQYVEETRQPFALTDYGTEGRSTDTNSPLYKEMRALARSIARELPSEFP